MALELDSRIVDELKATYKSLQNEGKLLSNEQSEKYYSTFRSRFGPDKLKNLDGEALLNLMHDLGNKDSLVYWLEFKDDDEFPSMRFGSISGGSSFKFGLFRRKETGKWTTGSPQNSQELSIEQAIDKARQHRDQLIKGIELLEKMPTNGTEEAYQQLQQEMDRVVPDISDSSWVHKYFSLLYPEKLDDFHNPDYQRFHLIKLLHLPPQGEGRYFAAGRFVAITQVLNIPMNSLAKMLNERDGSTPYSYWRIGTTAPLDKKDYWSMMRETNCVAIGLAGTSDLSTVTNDKAGKETIRKALLSHDPQMNHSVAGRIAQQPFHFRWTIAPGDLVLASNGATVLGIGKVTGEYMYDLSGGYQHRRRVEWLLLEQWQQPDQQPDIEGKLTTVYKMKRDANLLEAEKRIYGASPISTTSVEAPVAFTTSRPLLALPRLSSIPARI